MYGKIFDCMYEGTLYGHWEAIVTLQQMLVLCNSEGVIDMTPQAISARTSIPLEIIIKGIDILSEPDPYSRTPGEDGKRIVLMDVHRPWGWLIVNHAKYQKLRNRQDKLEADRQRIGEKRKSQKNNDVADCRKVSQSVADVAHAATTTATVTATATEKGIGDVVPQHEFEAAWKILPKRSGNNPKTAALKAWIRRIGEGVKPAAMIEGVQRYHRWCEATEKINTEMVMRGSTFFGPDRPFEQEFALPAAKAEKPWYIDSASAIAAKGAELGVLQEDRETFPDYKARVYRVAGVTSDMVRQAEVDWR